MGKKRKRGQTVHQEDDLIEPTIEGVHLYRDRYSLPWDIEPYWKQRHAMFSRYDEGIWTTDDSWFEVTHECIAAYVELRKGKTIFLMRDRKIAEHVASAKPAGKIIVVDCFAGIGGNAIAFALSGYKRVYAIEKNPAALACARHNAEIYGVHDKITFFEGDCYDVLGLNGHAPATVVLAEVIQKAGMIFASPPWGGPSYKEHDVFDLNNMPYSFEYMYSQFSKVTKDIILYLPRTSDLNQMADCLPDGEQAQIVHYCTYENSRAMCVYLGDWKTISGSQ